MSKNKTGAKTIPRLLDFAFRRALEGDEAKAREFWDTAIQRGYVPQQKPTRQFERALEEGRRKVANPDRALRS